MPPVVSKKPDAFAPAFDVVSGYFKGATQGQELARAESHAREADVLNREKLKEQQRTTNLEVDLRYQELAQREKDGRLTREQQERFNALKDKLARDLQTQQLGTQASIASAEIAQRRREADQNYTLRRTQQEDERAAATTTAKDVDRIEGVLAGIDVSTATPEQIDSFVMRAIEQEVGAARLYGGEGVVQLTPDEVKAKQEYYRNIIQNLPEYKKKAEEEMLRLTEEIARAKAKGESSALPSTPYNLRSVPFSVNDTDENVRFVQENGIKPVDRDALSIADRQTMLQVDQIVDDAVNSFHNTKNYEMVYNNPGSAEDQIKGLQFENENMRNYALSYLSGAISVERMKVEAAASGGVGGIPGETEGP
jgi:hypothetical protein